MDCLIPTHMCSNSFAGSCDTIYSDMTNLIHQYFLQQNCKKHTEEPGYREEEPHNECVFKYFYSVNSTIFEAIAWNLCLTLLSSGNSGRSTWEEECGLLREKLRQILHKSL